MLKIKTSRGGLWNCKTPTDMCSSSFLKRLKYSPRCTIPLNSTNFTAHCWGTDRFASLGAVIRYVPMNAHDVTLGRHCSQSLASTSVMFIFIYVYIHIYAIGIHDSYWTDGDENETPRCFYPNCLRLTVLILLIIYPIDFFYSELSLRIYVCFSS